MARPLPNTPAENYEERIAVDSFAAIHFAPTFDPDVTLHVSLGLRS